MDSTAGSDRSKNSLPHSTVRINALNELMTNFMKPRLDRFTSKCFLERIVKRQARNRLMVDSNDDYGIPTPTKPSRFQSQSHTVMNCVINAAVAVLQKAGLESTDLPAQTHTSRRDREKHCKRRAWKTGSTQYYPEATNRIGYRNYLRTFATGNIRRRTKPGEAQFT